MLFDALDSALLVVRLSNVAALYTYRAPASQFQRFIT